MGHPPHPARLSLRGAHWALLPARGPRGAQPSTHGPEWEGTGPRALAWPPVITGGRGLQAPPSSLSPAGRWEHAAGGLGNRRHLAERGVGCLGSNPSPTSHELSDPEQDFSGPHFPHLSHSDDNNARPSSVIGKTSQP